MTEDQMRNYCKVLLLQEGGASFDRACHDLQCCKGCYTSDEYIYCAVCYDEIMKADDEQDFS